MGRNNRSEGARRAVLFLMLACGCSSSGKSGTVAPPSGLHARAWQIDHYLVNYGAWPAAAVDVAHEHQLVIVNPSRADMHRQDIAAIQAGADAGDSSDDVLVLCYVGRRRSAHRQPER